MDDKEIKTLAALIRKFQLGTLTPEEEITLDEWRAADPQNEQRFQERLSEKFTIEGLSILQEAQEAMEQDFQRVTTKHRIISLRTKWRTYSAAAAVIFIVASGLLYFLFRNTPYQPASIAGKPGPTLAPGGNKAVLYLDNGRQIILDSMANGFLAQQGGSVVQKSADGQLAYVIGDKQNYPAVYNKIATPAGGQYKVILPDGSKVWLNDLSSLRFPTSFGEADRVVELTGEAYLEVAKMPLKPFRVKAGNTLVTVLGTHFNVNAYPDEKAVSTTLLEGMVSVTTPAKTVIIKPGQEARSGTTLDVINGADTSGITAWKDGYFEFSDADIRTVMRQLSRWYDVEVRFDVKAPSQTISGRISRNNTANDVLAFLEASGYHFKMDGKTIIVLP